MNIFSIFKKSVPKEQITKCITLMLPKNMKPSKEAFENLGFKFEKPAVGELLCKATLPPPWLIITTQNCFAICVKTAQKFS